MASANPNWPRWCFASVAKHLKEAGDSTFPIIIEGLDSRTDLFLQSKLRAEIRVTGPFLQEQQAEWRLWLDANVLISANMDGLQGYEISRVAGLFLEALTEPIPVWNYGSLDGDYDSDDPETQVFLGCLNLKKRMADPVGVYQLGQVEKTDRVRQTLVDATLEMYLDKNEDMA